MGFLGPPPKQKKAVTYRKAGKTLDAARRQKLVTLLRTEKKKQRALQGKSRPTTSLGYARGDQKAQKSGTSVPPLNISPAVRSTNSWSRPNSIARSDSGFNGNSLNSSKRNQTQNSEWTELLNTDAQAHFREHLYLKRLKKTKQKEFYKSLSDQVALKNNRKPVVSEVNFNHRLQLEQENARNRRAEQEKIRQRKLQDEEFRRVQDSHLKIRRERISKKEASDRRIEKQMVDQAKVEYQRQSQQHRLKMKEKMDFLAQAMEESHKDKASAAAAAKKREEEEQKNRQKHNKMIEKAWKVGGNHRQAEADRIRKIQDRLYNLGKIWMPEKKPETNDNGENSVSFEEIKRMDKMVKSLERRKKREAIREQRRSLEEQIKQKREREKMLKKEEEVFARDCQNAKYLADKLTVLHRERKSLNRERYASGLRTQLLENEKLRAEKYDGANAPMTAMERQMNASLLKTLPSRSGMTKLITQPSRSLPKSASSGGFLNMTGRSAMLNRTPDTNRSATKIGRLVPDSVVPPWQVEQTRTGELPFKEFRKNMVNPHENVLNGTYVLPHPNSKTGHWGEKGSIVNSANNKFLSSSRNSTGRRPGTSSSYASSQYSYRTEAGNGAYSVLRESFHPRKKSNWFDD